MSVVVGLMSDIRNDTIDGLLAIEPYSVLWSQTDLSNTEHTVMASMWASGGSVVVDAFMCVSPLFPWTLCDSPCLT